MEVRRKVQMKVKELIELLQSDDIDPEDEVLMFVGNMDGFAPITEYEHSLYDDGRIILV